MSVTFGMLEAENTRLRLQNLVNLTAMVRLSAHVQRHRPHIDGAQTETEEAYETIYEELVMAGVWVDPGFAPGHREDN